jgi:phosphohistidine phosphatase SixA
MPDVLLLCRHTKSEDELPVAVAERLRETLDHDGLDVATILHAPTPLATAHARWLATQLDGPAVRADERLAPATDATPGGLDELTRSIARGEGRAVLIIGHMPQLGWLAARMLGNRPWWRALVDGPAPLLPLKNAEVAAIVVEPEFRGRPAGWLNWTIAPDDATAVDEVREKIKSKMEVAKLLGGLMSLVLSGVLLAPGRLHELGDRGAVTVAAVAFLIAIGLFLRTMYAYDQLLMPRRFWGEQLGTRRPRWLVRRPPSSAAWVLYQNMMHIWTFVFTPATVAVLVGLIALAYAALDLSAPATVAVAIVLAAATAYALRQRPVLGTQD